MYSTVLFTYLWTVYWIPKDQRQIRRLLGELAVLEHPLEEGLVAVAERAAEDKGHLLVGLVKANLKKAHNIDNKAKYDR